MPDDFDTIMALAKRIAGVNRKIASDVFPDGAILLCAKCPLRERATSAQCAPFLLDGMAEALRTDNVC